MDTTDALTSHCIFAIIKHVTWNSEDHILIRDTVTLTTTTHLLTEYLLRSTVMLQAQTRLSLKEENVETRAFELY
jgi:hypothetical protein